MRLFVIMMALAGAVFTGGCDKESCDCPAFPNGDTVKVTIKEKIVVYNCCKDGLAIGFNSVKEDSRCPDGFNCIAMNPVWAGTAKISIAINSLQLTELEIGKPKQINFSDHTYTLVLTDLTPHPKSGLPTDPNSYEAEIVVSRD